MEKQLSEAEQSLLLRHSINPIINQTMVPGEGDWRGLQGTEKKVDDIYSINVCCCLCLLVGWFVSVIAPKLLNTFPRHLKGGQVFIPVWTQSSRWVWIQIKRQIQDFFSHILPRFYTHTQTFADSEGTKSDWRFSSEDLGFWNWRWCFCLFARIHLEVGTHS